MLYYSLSVFKTAINNYVFWYPDAWFVSVVSWSRCVSYSELGGYRSTALWILRKWLVR